ncbi:MAG TPA: thioredoxin domain-containing protein [Thermoanaerobaculia bacterium]|nr:thioredoxin domain-containing protein [Thermoanaerobaculia bacterium]
MRKLFPLAVLILLAVNASAATPPPGLETYLRRATMICPGSAIKIRQVSVAPPKNFEAWEVVQTSTDKYCGGTVYALTSATTGQVLVGHVISLSGGGGSVEQRVAARLGRAFGSSKIEAAIDLEPLEDGLRAVHVTRHTPDGPMQFRTWVDASNQFLIVGRVGNLSIDPRESLLRGIGMEQAATRGSASAPIRIVELSDFQCPMCRKAHETIEPFFQKNRERISYSRLDLPLTGSHDWTLLASLGAQAIRTVAPKHYWDYVDYIFSNQSEITKASIGTVMQGFCDMHDIDWKRVEPLIRDSKQRHAMLDQVGRSFEHGILATPTFLVNGQLVYFSGDGSHFLEYVRTLLEETGPKAAKPAK